MDDETGRTPCGPLYCRAWQGGLHGTPPGGRDAKGTHEEQRMPNNRIERHFGLAASLCGSSSQFLPPYFTTTRACVRRRYSHRPGFGTRLWQDLSRRHK